MAEGGGEENRPLPTEPAAPASHAKGRDLIGSVRFLVSDEELIEPLFEDWEPDPID